MDPVRRDVQYFALPQYGVDGARAFGRKGLSSLFVMTPIEFGMAKRRVRPIPYQVEMSTRRRRRQYVALRPSEHGHHVPAAVVVRLRDDAPHAEAALDALVLPNIRHEEVFRARSEAR